MYRKLVLSGVSVLAFMTLVASAQQPAGLNTGTVQPQPLLVQQGEMIPGNMSLDVFGGRVRKEEFELAHKSQELVKQLAKAEGEKRDKIKDQLTDTLGKQFDFRQKRHKADIDALEAQLKKLKDLVQKRQENRREIISKRLEQLTREAEGLGW